MTTIHVLPNPSGITSEEYRTDAFGIAACKFITTMKKFGYNLIHYGHQESKVDCENIIVITNEDFPAPENRGAMLYHQNHLADLFSERANPLLKKMVNDGDIVVSFYGSCHEKTTRDINPKAYIVEPSIGYGADTTFAPYRAFVSYAWMHYYYGLNKQVMSPSWYDEVIPNAFDPNEFEYCEDKDDYFVYLGRMLTCKGIDLAIQVTERLNKNLVIASSGSLKEIGYDTLPKHVIEIGYVGMEERKKLLSKAKCLMAPTYYIEPFGNIVVEAGLSGTPVLTTDWGGFAENVAHGATGFRCKDFNGFLKAANLVLDGKIKSHNCRKYTESNYNLDIIHRRMDAWFRKIKTNDFYYVDQ
jgi:glycosyltransferase involved in cell wall biosynthesis